MAKTIAPLLSFSGSGQIAKTQVYSTWKGRSYVRRYTIPANPNTASQQETRSVFRWLSKLWQFLPAAAQTPWAVYARNLQITDRNALLKNNIASMRGDTDLGGFLATPSANGGIAAPSITLTGGNDQATVAAVAPTLPSGWSIVAMHAILVPEQDPQTDTPSEVQYVTDVTAPYSVVATGLQSVVTYAVGVWFEMLKSDGSTAYGQSKMGTVLTT